MKTKLLVSIFSLLLFCAAAQERNQSKDTGVSRRNGKPDCIQVTDDNKAMAQAVQKARKSLDKFIAAVRSPKGNQSRFAIKKPFIEGDKVEHIWINEVSFDGKVFHGKVDNEPVDIKGVRLGDEVTASPDEVSDWMYVQDGRLVGGYTTRCLCRNLSRAEKKQFEKDAGCRID